MSFFRSSTASVRKKLSTQIHHGSLFLCASLGIMLILLMMFSISYHNRNATLGYKLKELQKQRSEIVAEIEILEMKIADQSSIAKMEQLEEENADRMQKGNKTIYLKGEKAVASEKNVNVGM